MITRKTSTQKVKSREMIGKKKKDRTGKPLARRKGAGGGEGRGGAGKEPLGRHLGTSSERDTDRPLSGFPGNEAVEAGGDSAIREPTSGVGRTSNTPAFLQE